MKKIKCGHNGPKCSTSLYTVVNFKKKSAEDQINVFTRLSFLPKVLNVFLEIVAIPKGEQIDLALEMILIKKTPFVNLIGARNCSSLFN
jgi:hypothetical protein